jgi:hypothetical protein
MKVPNIPLTASSSAHTGHPHAEWTRLARIVVGDYVHPGKDARTPKLLTMTVVRVDAVESTGKGRARLTLADGMKLEAATGSKFWRVRAELVGRQRLEAEYAAADELRQPEAGVQLGAYRAAAAERTTWRSLKRNDWIVCPSSGLPEQVTRSERRPNGEWFVRTTRHDHYRQAGEAVELTEAPKVQPKRERQGPPVNSLRSLLP